MTQTEKANAFARLHQPGTPLILYNSWDAASSKAVEKAGASAIATGSWAMARAHGFDDGQTMPLDLVLTLLRRICTVTDLPVTLDFEAGYATDLPTLATHVAHVIAAGAIGINFEDRNVGGAGLVALDDQCNRIAALRAQADHDGVPLFINARTDLFFQGAKPDTHAALLPNAIERAQAYARSGANGIFVPGLSDLHLLGEFCTAINLPVNVMRTGDTPSLTDLAACNVARISHGPAPFLATQAALTDLACGVFNAD